jgi:hypothetical protein
VQIVFLRCIRAKILRRLPGLGHFDAENRYLKRGKGPNQLEISPKLAKSSLCEIVPQRGCLNGEKTLKNHKLSAFSTKAQ